MKKICTPGLFLSRNFFVVICLTAAAPVDSLLFFCFTFKWRLHSKEILDIFFCFKSLLERFPTRPLKEGKMVRLCRAIIIRFYFNLPRVSTESESWMEPLTISWSLRFLPSSLNEFYYFDGGLALVPRMKRKTLPSSNCLFRQYLWIPFREPFPLRTIPIIQYNL